VHATLARLDGEWRDLATSEQSRATLADWQRVEPALGEGGDLADVLERRRNHLAAPAILAALARLAPSEPLAARVLLQALVPGLVRLAATAGYDDPAALDEMVSLAWERIRTYPTTRHGSVAANVLLDTRKWYRKHRAIEAPCGGLNRDTAGAEACAPSAESIVIERSVAAEVRAACRADVISVGALELIVRTRVGGEPLELVANEEGCGVSQLAQRRWRAERRLRSWVTRAAV
jgi:hypothetical protein